MPTLSEIAQDMLNTFGTEADSQKLATEAEQKYPNEFKETKAKSNFHTALYRERKIKTTGTDPISERTTPPKKSLASSNGGNPQSALVAPVVVMVEQKEETPVVPHLVVGEKFKKGNAEPTANEILRAAFVSKANPQVVFLLDKFVEVEKEFGSLTNFKKCLDVVEYLMTNLK